MEAGGAGDMVNAIAGYLVDGFFEDYLGTQRRSFADNVLTYNVQSLAASPRDYAKQALDQWAKISGITFVETNGPAQITFRTEGWVSATYFDIRDGKIWSADVVQSHWMGSADWRSQVQNWAHEIGHALGLGHPGPYNGDPAEAIFSDDDTSVSIMSYFHIDRIARTPQEADVMAIRELYGEPVPVATGDDAYAIRADEHWHIVDDGGRDKIEAVAVADDFFDMMPGGESNAFSTDPDTIIEDLTVYAEPGYSVEIVGNSADNIITISDAI